MPSFEQDPTEPTGIKDLTPRGNSEVARARARKADAALAMRIKLVSWDDIAEALGYPDGKAVQVATELALEHDLLTDESQTFLRRIASGRLDEMLSSIYPRATNDEDPDQLMYYDRALKTIAQHAKLNGYEAPQQFVVNNPTSQQIEQWVAQVSAGQAVEIPEADIFEAEVVES